MQILGTNDIYFGNVFKEKENWSVSAVAAEFVIKAFSILI